MDRGAWWSTVHGVTNSQTQLATNASTLLQGERIFTNYIDNSPVPEQGHSQWPWGRAFCALGTPFNP